jgi:hypothetical protein
MKADETVAKSDPARRSSQMPASLSTKCGDWITRTLAGARPVCEGTADPHSSGDRAASGDGQPKSCPVTYEAEGHAVFESVPMAPAAYSSASTDGLTGQVLGRIPAADW